MSADESDDFGGGLPWDSLKRLSEAHSAMIPHALRLIVAMRGSGRMRADLAAAASMIKQSETKVSAIVQALPHLFSFEAGATRIRLRTEPPDPWDMTKEELAAIDRKVKAQERAAERRRQQLENDKRDTGYNRVWKALHALGMLEQESRKFGFMLNKTYPEDIVHEAIKIASEQGAAEPKGYILSVIKSRISKGQGAAGGGSGPSPRANTVKASIRPDASRPTTFLGWEDRDHNGRRHKLFRLPDGRLQRANALAGEAVPTYQQDPGLRVEG